MEQQTLDAARRLIGGARWLALGTTSAQGAPSVTYLPFATLSSGFGIVASALAAHTAELRANPRAGIMLVGDAAQGDVFACPRLSVQVIALDRSETPEAEEIWARLARRSGETVAVLRALPDFRPFLLQPLRARLILGFAQASTLESAELATLLRDF